MATHTIIPGGRVTSGPVQSGLTAKEVPLYLDPDQVRRTEYTVYLHSISKRSHEQPHPIYRNVIIPACPKDKRYITFFRVVSSENISFDGPSDTQSTRLQIDIFCLRYGDSDALLKQVIKTMVNAFSVGALDTQDFPPDPSTDAFRCMADVTLWSTD